MTGTGAHFLYVNERAGDAYVGLVRGSGVKLFGRFANDRDFRIDRISMQTLFSGYISSGASLDALFYSDSSDGHIRATKPGSDLYKWPLLDIIGWAHEESPTRLILPQLQHLEVDHRITGELVASGIVQPQRMIIQGIRSITRLPPAKQRLLRGFLRNPWER